MTLSTIMTSSTRAAAPSCVDLVFSPHSRGNIDAYAELIRPFGEITAIDEPEGLDLPALKPKSIAWHWELMFTRSMYQTPDMVEQKRVLERVAQLVDEQRIRTTVTETIGDVLRPEFGELTSWSNPAG
jgi:NADPH:quinone reductase